MPEVTDATTARDTATTGRTGATAAAHDASSVRRGTNHAMATSVSLVMFIPIYLVVVNSLKTDAAGSSRWAPACRGSCAWTTTTS